MLLHTVICFALPKLPCIWQISRRDIPLLFTFAEMSQFRHHHVQCTKLGSANFSSPSPPAMYHMPGTCPMWFTLFPCLHNIMAVINKWWNPNMPRCCSPECRALDLPGKVLQPFYWLAGFLYGLCAQVSANVGSCHSLAGVHLPAGLQAPMLGILSGRSTLIMAMSLHLTWIGTEHPCAAMSSSSRWHQPNPAVLASDQPLIEIWNMFEPCDVETLYIYIYTCPSTSVDFIADWYSIPLCSTGQQVGPVIRARRNKQNRWSKGVLMVQDIDAKDM